MIWTAAIMMAACHQHSSDAGNAQALSAHVQKMKGYYIKGLSVFICVPHTRTNNMMRKLKMRRNDVLYDRTLQTTRELYGVISHNELPSLKHIITPDCRMKIVSFETDSTRACVGGDEIVKYLTDFQKRMLACAVCRPVPNVWIFDTSTMECDESVDGMLSYSGRTSEGDVLANKIASAAIVDWQCVDHNDKALFGHDFIEFCICDDTERVQLLISSIDRRINITNKHYE